MNKTKLEKFLYIEPGALSDDQLDRWARACFRVGLKNLRRLRELAHAPELTDEEHEEHQYLSSFAYSEGQLRYLARLLGEKFRDQDLLTGPPSDILRPWRQTPLPRTERT